MSKFIKVKDEYINFDNVIYFQPAGPYAITFYLMGYNDCVRYIYDSTEERNNEIKKLGKQLNINNPVIPNSNDKLYALCNRCSIIAHTEEGQPMRTHCEVCNQELTICESIYL